MSTKEGKVVVWCPTLLSGTNCSFFLLQHNFKKIRNNILKSSTDESPTRCLTLRGKTITWDQFWKAFSYDQGEFSMSLHHKLTVDHFQLDPASKMRNHLAEDVLDRNILALMKVFFSSKGMHSVFCQSKVIKKKKDLFIISLKD